MKPIPEILAEITDKEDMQQISDAWSYIHDNAANYGNTDVFEAWDVLVEMAKNAMDKCPNQFFRKYENTSN